MTSVDAAAAPAASAFPLEPRPLSRRWAHAAVVTLAAAGALHLVAAADHRSGPDPVVAFFLAVALAQLGTAVWLAVEARTRHRPGSLPVLLATVATVGLLLLYLAAHTTDLLTGVVGGSVEPLDGGHTHPTTATGVESAGWLGSATVAVEVVLLLALMALLPSRARRLAADGLLALGALVWALWLFG